MDTKTGAGLLDEKFRVVAQLFERYLEDDGFAAQLSIRWHGDLVVDLAGGDGVTAESLTGVYSVSKGVAALVIARLIDAGRLDTDARVAQYWPEFGAQGKDAVTVRQVLSHQAGLPAVLGRHPLPELLESSLTAARLAEQAPLWRPGSAFGYHAATIGVLMEELVRRVTGETLQSFYEREVRAPRDADFHLGLPAELDHRYVEVRDVVPTAVQAAEIAARPPSDALAESVFDNFDVAPPGLIGMSTNNELVRRAGPAAIGGVGAARGIARLYADALPDATDPIASPETFRMMAQQHSWGQDRVLDAPNSFGLVFMLPQPRLPFAGLGAFGHDGAGGALGFADPTTGLAFGYIPMPMQYPGGADHRAVALARLARQVVLT
jgi:CubicO group peptidase (beta-lactamase class C family)